MSILFKIHCSFNAIPIKHVVEPHLTIDCALRLLKYCHIFIYTTRLSANVKRLYEFDIHFNSMLYLIT